MNSNIIRTTITLPADLLEAAKAAAYYRKTSVSELIRSGLREEVYRPERKQVAIRKISFIGKYKLGYRGLSREEIYEPYLKEKLSSGY